jgi:hypothetical protein
MSYIGASPTTAAFLTDTFSANGSGTVFTLSTAPANTNSILVAVSGVLQDPSTYSVSGTTLTFSAAPPAGTGNISVRFLGIPASGVTTTAYRTQTEFTATAGQTTFTPPSYTVGFIDVYRNGVLLGSADFTATNGTTVVLAAGATAGDLIETVSFLVSSVLNAIPATAGAVTTPYLLDGSVTAAKMGANGTWAPAGSVIQVVQGIYSTQTTTTSTSFVDSGLSASITPKFATSKILVTVNGIGKYNRSLTNIDAGIGLQIVRGSTSVYNHNIAYYTYIQGASSVNDFYVQFFMNYLDSPATTSNTTYKLQFRTYTGEARTQTDSAPSSITLMEIAA